MTQEIVLNIIGLIGPLLFAYAYAMVALGRWESTRPRFHILNIVGSLCVLASLTVAWNLPLFLIEIAWAGVGIYGLLRRPAAT
jgi:paired small multidrug resistance pump